MWYISAKMETTACWSRMWSRGYSAENLNCKCGSKKTSGGGESLPGASLCSLEENRAQSAGEGDLYGKPVGRI